MQLLQFISLHLLLSRVCVFCARDSKKYVAKSERCKKHVFAAIKSFAAMLIGIYKRAPQSYNFSNNIYSCQQCQVSLRMCTVILCAFYQLSRVYICIQIKNFKITGMKKSREIKYVNRNVSKHKIYDPLIFFQK